MDDLLCTMQKRKPTKRSKPKSKPIKVVYISNPMRVKTSASQFRALVQELTGRDAELPDPSRFDGSDLDGVAAGGRPVPRAVAEVDGADGDVAGPERRSGVPKVGSVEDHRHHHQNHPGGDLGRLVVGNHEPLDDDVFTPQMLETLAGLFPSGLSYESTRMDVV